MSEKRLFRTLLPLTALLLASQGALLAEVRPPAVPAKIAISVDPVAATPGSPVQVKLDLQPITGVKINRYPQVKLEVPGKEGVVAAGKAAAGSATPPPVEKMSTNYFEQFDGLELELAVDESAPAGRHQVEGKLTYFYCMPANGFCAPHRVPVKIPIEIR